MSFKFTRSLRALPVSVRNVTTTRGRTQQYFSTIPASSSSSSSNNNNNNNHSITTQYISPYADYFNNITNNSSSSLLSGDNGANDEEKTITPPTITTLKCGIPEHVLKFKTTSYPRLMLPPYTQPSEYKVTLQINYKDIQHYCFSLSSSNNNDITIDKYYQVLKQVVGKRLNEQTKSLTLTSNHFASRIENKRHLCSMLDRIVLGVKRLVDQS